MLRIEVLRVEVVLKVKSMRNGVLRGNEQKILVTYSFPITVSFVSPTDP